MATSSGSGASLFLLSSSSSSSSSSPLKLLSFSQPSLSFKLHISISTPTISLNSSLPFPPLSKKKFGFELYSAVQEIEVEEAQEGSVEDKRKKLYVVNLPWTLSVADIKNLFGECGTVKDVEIIKQKDGRNRGYAFITMASGDEARAVIDKFDSYELSGRIIRVEFAKRLKKPSPLPAATPTVETRHKLYVSNLAWKARSSHLRELFSASFNPVSARVVFDSPSGRSAGYGFVSFATKEEADAALSALDGKELLGRPIRLKFSLKNVDESGSEPEVEDNAESEAEEASDAAEKSEES